MTFWDTWFTGGMTLTVGLLAGAVAAWRLMKKGSMGADLEMQLNDLDEQLEHMVSQLKDIDLQRDRIAESFYAEQRELYEGKAAALMRERDLVVERLGKLQGTGALEKVDAAPTRKSKSKKARAKTAAKTATASEANAAVVEAKPGFFAQRPQLAGALWGAGTMIVIGGLFLSVTSEQTSRAPGGSITGNTQPGQGPGPMAERPAQPAQSSAAASASAPPSRPAEGRPARPQDPKIQEMMDRVEKDPNDVEAMNYLTGRLVLGGAMPEAARLNARVLQVDPENVQGRTYAAMLDGAKGDITSAIGALEAIIAKHDEKAPDAYFFRGMIAMQGGDTNTMQKYWSRFVEVAPPSPRRDRIAQMLQGMTAAVPQ